VLIEGESGTGKELFAEAIHSGGSRRERRLVAINCAAIPENLIESELFGYEEGSFTGARKGGQAGKFELAEGGTLFLDEVGDMPLSVQMKLLRAIQEKSVTHIGSATERPVDIRLIAATNKNLSAEVQQGRFRQDLYYRLHVVTMRIPPLRERPEDIPALARHLAGRLAERLRFSPVQMEPAFLEKLQSYAWPGNVRELENAIERAMVEAGDGIPLTTELLEFDAPGSPARSAAAADGSLKSLDEVEAETIRQALLFAVGMGTCGRGNGAEGVYHAFADLISRTGMDVQSGKQDLPI
jgi:transcriptional regulator with PAS, ATPase and Fis domain